MRTHPVPGQVVEEWIFPARGTQPSRSRKGRRSGSSTSEGQQVADLVCFNEHDLTEEINPGNSLLLNKHREFVVGDVLYSIACNPMMTITGYSNAESYLGPMCSEELNRIRDGVPGTPNCRDNFAAALSERGFGPRDIPNAFVPFMRVEVDERGSLEIREPTSRPGDHYDLRAEMDLLVGVSNCPQERNPCNAFNPTAMGVIVYASNRDVGI